MAVHTQYLQWVLEQLAGAKRVSSKRLFGGVGLYRDDVIFGLISGETLYFKVDDATRCDYEKRGMRRFRPYPDKPLLSMTYYEVPPDVIEDPDACVAWALRAAAAALPKTKLRPGKKTHNRRLAMPS
jgi:DNA transformation protein